MKRDSLLLRARWILQRPDRLLQDGAVLLEDDRIAEVARNRAEGKRIGERGGARTVDLGDVLLAPGLVNAHAHLELSGMAGLLPRDGGFVPWIGALMRERRARGPERIERDLLEGAARCVETGTTCVGDIDSTGASAALLGRRGPRVVVYRECLDGDDPGRSAAVLEAAREVGRVEGGDGRAGRLLPGLSPHAPHTVSEELLAGLGELAASRRLPVTIHWSETEEECSWLLEGTGPFSRLLEHSSGRSGLDRIEAAGLLGERTSLVHGNHPTRGEPERIAAAGATLVHCPGTHDFFRRGEFPLRRWLDAGVDVALGTDGLACNGDLDMRREMALLRGRCPWLSPERVWSMATLSGARALGLAGEVGELRRGARADLVAHGIESDSAAELLEELTHGRTSVRGVWIGGRPAPGEAPG